MARLLKGGPVAESMCQRLQKQVETLGQIDVVPVFGIVRVGERPNDVSYERGAMKRAASLGVEVRRFLLLRRDMRISIPRRMQQNQRFPG